MAPPIDEQLLVAPLKLTEASSTLPAPCVWYDIHRIAPAPFFEHTENLAREVRADDVLGVEEVAQLVLRQSVDPGIPRVKFRPQQCAPRLAPAIWRGR